MKIANSLGLTSDQRDELFVRHAIVGRTKRNEIDYQASYHTKGVQDSKYLCIDTSHQTSTKFVEMKNEEIINGGRKTEVQGNVWKSIPLSTAPRFGMQNVHLKYCKPIDVGKKRKVQLNSKATFLVKLGNMRHSAQLLAKSEAVYNWIDENIDQLYVPKANMSEYKQKMDKAQFTQKLFDYACQALKTTQSRQRKKQIKEAKSRIGDNMDYGTKN